jgi:hypothetical protein
VSETSHLLRWRSAAELSPKWGKPPIGHSGQALGEFSQCSVNTISSLVRPRHHERGTLSNGKPWHEAVPREGPLGVRLSAYALVETGDSEAIDVFLRRDDAVAALEDAVRDEPSWAGMLSVQEFELDEWTISWN